MSRVNERQSAGEGQRQTGHHGVSCARHVVDVPSDSRNVQGLLVYILEYGHAWRTPSDDDRAVELPHESMSRTTETSVVNDRLARREFGLVPVGRDDGSSFVPVVLPSL